MNFFTPEFFLWLFYEFGAETHRNDVGITLIDGLVSADACRNAIPGQFKSH